MSLRRSNRRASAIKRAAVAVVGAWVLLGVGRVEAVDSIYPGTACRIWVTLAGQTGEFAVEDSCSIISSGELTRHMKCTVVDHTPTDSVAFDSLRLTVLDQSERSDVSCSTVSENWAGDLRKSTNKRSQGFSSSRTNLNYSSQAGYASGHMYLECSVPHVDISYSGICAYRVVEP